MKSKDNGADPKLVAKGKELQARVKKANEEAYRQGSQAAFRYGITLRSGDDKGYAKGGKVKGKGGRVHKGEFVIKKSAASKIGTKKLNKMNRAPKAAPRKRR